MHLIVQLLYEGFDVGSIDVDGRQGTLSRYIENRQAYMKLNDKPLPFSVHHRLTKSSLPDVPLAEQEDQTSLQNAMRDLGAMDFIVIDTPGSDQFLSRQAHSCADTLITPLNDSFIDLDLLVRLDNTSHGNLHPSTYAETVWDQRKQRAARDAQTIDWIVLRNRLGNLYTKNKEHVDQVLTALSKRIGFRLGSGFGERVIFRELFPSGLTLLDLESTGMMVTLSHVAARQELRGLMSMIPTFQKAEKAS
jgi:chromosome partitioning protein